MAYTQKPMGQVPRPQPVVPNAPSARLNVVKELKKKERPRYSTMADAARVAAIDRVG